VRRIDELGRRDWSLPHGRLTVKGHPALRASISLTAVTAGARGDGPQTPAFVPGFARAGLVPLDVAGASRAAAAGTALELTNIEHADSLAMQPLELLLDVPLADDEGILPLVFDGEHVWLGGQPMRDEAGVSHVTIDRLPGIPAERRSMGSSLKLYFFKTYLQRVQVNRLSVAGRGADGSLVRSTDGVAARIATARRVLLLVHGLIGDTDGMAEAVRACGLDSRFDLVLCYDYENLSTPINTTARQLAATLREVGLAPGDGKHLTLLTESMGGLVARWFIEHEGGDGTVDHLVMCGTPNKGTPFGDVAGARAVLTMLIGLAANAAPWLLPYTAPVLLALNRSAKLTPTLEQMATGSEFMAQLNIGPRPAVRYTVLAGNVDEYDEPGDPLFARLLTRLGRGGAFDRLFGRRPNDIVVAVDSILDGARDRPGAVSLTVACHHLNYFSSRAGRAALAALDW
jgi:hypothetical protein